MNIYHLDHELQLALYHAVRALHTFSMAILWTLTPSCITGSYSANRPFDYQNHAQNHARYVMGHMIKSFQAPSRLCGEELFIIKLYNSGVSKMVRRFSVFQLNA